MWALAVLLLSTSILFIGAAVAFSKFIIGPKGTGPRMITIAAISIGLAAAPIVTYLAPVVFASWFQKSDLELYQEIFDSGTTVPPERIIFDEFGHGPSREIYMRIYPDAAEREALASLPGLKPSSSTLDEFIARGNQHGFMWWLSSDPNFGDYCQSARIREADGFRGWRQLRVAECYGEDGVRDSKVYVIAWHRAD